MTAAASSGRRAVALLRRRLDRQLGASPAWWPIANQSVPGPGYGACSLALMRDGVSAPEVGCCRGRRSAEWSNRPGRRGAAAFATPGIEWPTAQATSRSPSGCEGGGHPAGPGDLCRPPPCRSPGSRGRGRRPARAPIGSHAGRLPAGAGRGRAFEGIPVRPARGGSRRSGVRAGPPRGRPPGLPSGAEARRAGGKRRLRRGVRRVHRAHESQPDNAELAFWRGVALASRGRDVRGAPIPGRPTQERGLA